jgi:hypothetical protein
MRLAEQITWFQLDKYFQENLDTINGFWGDKKWSEGYMDASIFFVVEKARGGN